MPIADLADQAPQQQPDLNAGESVQCKTKRSGPWPQPLVHDVATAAGVQSATANCTRARLVGKGTALSFAAAVDECHCRDWLWGVAADQAADSERDGDGDRA